MNKPVLGLILGGVLGALDGLTALLSAPEVKPEIMTIVAGSTGKGLLAGLLIGFIARKVNDLTASIVFGVLVAALLALPIALNVDPATGKRYFWEIMIPGSIVGLIVGYATQKYGRAARPVLTGVHLSLPGGRGAQTHSFRDPGRPAGAGDGVLPAGVRLALPEVGGTDALLAGPDRRGGPGNRRRTASPGSIRGRARSTRWTSRTARSSCAGSSRRAAGP